MSPPAEPDSPPDPAASFTPAVQEVRYSLPALLAELRLDRSSGYFAQEKLSQVEIGTLFTSPSKRRAKKPRR